MNSFITLHTFSSRLEAEIAKGLLEANGIKALVSADDAGGNYPLTMTSGVELIINSRNLVKAKKLLAVKSSEK